MIEILTRMANTFGPIIWMFLTSLWLLNVTLDTINRYKRWRREK